MIYVIHLIIGFLIIIFIVPQTSTENIVLRKLLNTGFFTGYSEAKKFLQVLTWSLIFLFFLITFYLSLAS